MLKDVNDSLAQAEQVATWTSGLNVHVNLIPFNPVADAPHLESSSLEVIRQFSAALKSAGLKVTIRYSLGADIAAACGQLVRKRQQATGQGLAEIV